MKSEAVPRRLPIHHPEYRYPRSRNPYWEKLRAFGSRVFADNEAETQKGKWRSHFETPIQELHVEIGCNAGHVSVEWAARSPTSGFIGIDYKVKAIHRAAEKVAKRGLKNLLFLRAHAARLEYIFAPGEIDFLYLYFPDPWPKKAHWKNRYVTAGRLKSVAKLMKPGGVFHIKTDHAGYFEWMETEIAQARDFFEVIERSTDLHASHPAPETLTFPEVTLFERLFIRDGIKIHSLKLKRI